ncbi:glycosyltransferase family 2 protein [Brenneria sp. g21c3]|uniref:glycosyltransferase family 2 protein n=1 Tax=Brenneria sp. g21c3 TaxID=3093893 RepID=UPI002EA5E9CE|nr:glycosyltransferase family 2 protein [Brenneria sp. g21c3]
MEKIKRIDVLLASYNGSKFIEEQIESLIINFKKITEYNCRILLSDDGSTDRTLELIKEMECRYPEFVCFLDGKKKGGVRENFNFLINSTDADYVFFCDQDDFWLPNKMKLFMEEFQKLDTDNEPTLIHSDLCVVDDKLCPINISMFDYQKINKNPTLKEIIVSNSVTGCVMACNKKLIDLAKKSDLSKSIMHDWYIAILAFAFGNVRFINSPLILYRQHGENGVGAKKMTLSSVLEKNSLSEIIEKSIKSLTDTKKQAELIIINYGDMLGNKELSVLNEYVNSFSYSFPHRFWFYLCGGVRKFGMLRKAGIFLVYILRVK